MDIVKPIIVSGSIPVDKLILVAGIGAGYPSSVSIVSNPRVASPTGSFILEHSASPKLPGYSINKRTNRTESDPMD